VVIINTRAVFRRVFPDDCGQRESTNRTAKSYQFTDEADTVCRTGSPVTTLNGAP
jgi:hypothetical protein